MINQNNKNLDMNILITGNIVQKNSIFLSAKFNFSESYLLNLCVFNISTNLSVTMNVTYHYNKYN